MQQPGPHVRNLMCKRNFRFENRALGMQCCTCHCVLFQHGTKLPPSSQDQNHDCQTIHGSHNAANKPRPMAVRCHTMRGCYHKHTTCCQNRACPCKGEHVWPNVYTLACYLVLHKLSVVCLRNQQRELTGGTTGVGFLWAVCSHCFSCPPSFPFHFLCLWALN